MVECVEEEHDSNYGQMDVDSWDHDDTDDVGNDNDDDGGEHNEAKTNNMIASMMNICALSDHTLPTLLQNVCSIL